MAVRTQGGSVQQPVTYLFVDAGHLKPNFSHVMQRWFGKPVELDMAGLRSLFSATKIFYYDSIDDVPRPNESAEEVEARIREQELALREINAIQNTHVRYGSVTGRDRRKRRQKEVDILIAVDMMNHAVRQNMDKAVLLTGDRDFTPLVETLVQLGLSIHVAGDYRYTSDVLKEAADYYQALTLIEYSQLVEHAAKQAMPAFPSFTHGAVDRSTVGDPLTTGPIGNEIGHAYFVHTRNCFAVEIENRHGARHILMGGRQDLDKLALYLELQHEGVGWLRELTHPRLA
jgi:uncharacterized LabA/DUF88 family protein